MQYLYLNHFFHLLIYHLLAVRTQYTTKGNKEHPIHSYKLKGLEITRANQVWSTDITYIRIKGGFVLYSL